MDHGLWSRIFQESVGISYAKQSNMGTLSGLNVAGQQANPMNELDFQVAAKMVPKPEPPK